MHARGLVHRLWAHAVWADALLLDALEAGGDALPTAWHEYAHVLGAEAVWLARLEERQAPVAVWPVVTPGEIAKLRSDNAAGYEAYLARATDESLQRGVEYRNSAGQTFCTPPLDVLAHVALHGQYHRGKINLLLRQAGAEPAPVDFISYVRGVPAAVTTLHGRPGEDLSGRGSAIAQAAGVRRDDTVDPTHA